MRPPTKEVKMPMPMALPASPLSAIGPPSNTVAMEEGVPGIFSRMAEIRPPDMPPRYKPTSSEMPFMGSMPKDMGKNRISAMVELRPGMEPKMMPITTPMKIRSRQKGLSNTMRIASMICCAAMCLSSLP